MASAIQTAIAKTGHASFQKVDTVPGVDSATENVMYLVLNPKTKHYDIYAKIKGTNGSYTMEQLDDTTVDLSGYVQKENGKRLMTDAESAKLAGIAEGANKYTHPTYTARSSGLYKVTVDAYGHVTEVAPVTKEDITGLGIPGTNTTYSPMSGATSSAAGTNGLVPAPPAEAQGKFLRGDGTWQPLVSYGEATATNAGLMSARRAPFASKAYPHGGVGCILLHHKGGPFNGIWTIGRGYYALHLAAGHGNHAGRR